MPPPLDANRWPELPYAAWKDTCATLHLWTQIIGKIRLAQTPWINHSWHVTLYLTARGLTTSPIPYRGRAFQIDFDFVEHVLWIRTSEGHFRQLMLAPRSVAEFHSELFAALAELDIRIAILTMPCEIADAIPFDQDCIHAAYDRDYANRFWRILLSTHDALTCFRTGFLGKVSPVHFFWGSFDLAVTRFSGRKAPRHPGGVPHLPDAVAREAYSHEVSSAGFWPGGGGPVDYAAFYSYAYPAPDGFADARVRPGAAFFSKELGEFVLPYDAVRTASDPEGALMEFLQSTYEAAARLGQWDRGALERARGEVGKPPLADMNALGLDPRPLAGEGRERANSHGTVSRQAPSPPSGRGRRNASLRKKVMTGVDNASAAPGETSDAIVRVTGLSKRYGRTVALDGIDLAIRPNELFALLGPNGAGKTTLIHILCTILPPDAGTVTLAGFDVVREPRQARRHLGVVFQEPSVDDRLTVFENLNFHGLIYQVPAAQRHKRIDELLGLVELENWRHALVRSLSSGMKRRVEIARALIHDSDVLVLDEPTTGLDAQSRERIWAYLMRLRKERALTVIVTTHYIEEVEGCDRICVIDRGRILAIDTPAALKAAHGRELIRAVPDDTATADAIRAAYPAAKTFGDMPGGDGAIVIEADGEGVAEAFLKKFGGRVRRLSVDSPSLESVFLSLTGRELRDQAAGKRERTYAFGRRGGEHTR